MKTLLSIAVEKVKDIDTKLEVNSVVQLFSCFFCQLTSDNINLSNDSIISIIRIQLSLFIHMNQSLAPISTFPFNISVSKIYQNRFLPQATKFMQLSLQSNQLNIVLASYFVSDSRSASS